MQHEAPSSFGELLRTFRKRSRLTQQQLAATLGVHYNTISGWERGDTLPDNKGIVLELGKQLHLDDLESRQLLEASLTALAPYWHVPLRRNLFFTGRQRLLETLHHRLGADQIVALTQSYAIHGLGGIGKTQLAVEYAYRHALEYAAVFWISAESVEQILASFFAIAEQLRLPERQEADQQRMIAAIQGWLSRHSKWLLIWDNLEEVELLRRYLPPTRQGAVLITTRRQGLGVLAQDLELSIMTPEEGLLLLLRRAKLLTTEAGTEQVEQLAVSRPAEYLAAQEVVRTLGGLPLALDQAGAYIQDTRCSFRAYLSLLQSSQLRLLDERDASTEYPLSVVKTFTLVFEQLEQNNTLAVEIITVCAFLAPEAIPELFFLEGATQLGSSLERLATDPFAFQDALKALLASSLIQRDASTHTLSVHRLVQVVLKERLSPTTRRVWIKRITGVMAHLFPFDEDMQTDYWRTCEQLLSHALVCLSHSEHESEQEMPALALMCHVATYLTKRTRYAEAEPLFAYAAQMGERVLGSRHSLVAEALNGQGRLCYEQGRDDVAEPLLLRALHIWEQALGSDHPQLAWSLINLGNLYCQQGKYEEAEPLYQQALHIRKQALGSDHASVAYPLNNLGNLYYLQGRYAEAEPLYQQALRIREQALGSDHPQLAYTLTCLGELYRQQARDEQAEPLLERALRIWEQALGSDHPQLAYPLNNLGELYRQQGRYAEAEPLYQQALRIREQVLGSDHPQLAYPLNNLGELYRQQGRYAEAEPLYQQALHIWEQALGSDHPQLAYPLNGLANLSQEQRQYDQAEALYQRARSLRQKHLGLQHVDVSETLHDLARLRQLQQRHTDALSLYRQALAIREQSLGPHHPETLKTRIALFEISGQIGHTEEKNQIPKPTVVSLCACGCAREVDRSKSRGEPRRFFSNACRQRFYRNASRQKRNTTSE